MSVQGLSHPSPLAPESSDVLFDSHPAALPQVTPCSSAPDALLASHPLLTSPAPPAPPQSRFFPGYFDPHPDHMYFLPFQAQQTCCWMWTWLLVTSCPFLPSSAWTDVLSVPRRALPALPSPLLPLCVTPPRCIGKNTIPIASVSCCVNL